MAESRRHPPGSQKETAPAKHPIAQRPKPKHIAVMVKSGRTFNEREVEWLIFKPVSCRDFF